jgi:hypothetical protein
MPSLAWGICIRIRKNKLEISTASCGFFPHIDPNKEFIVKGKEMETTALFTDLSAEEAETVNGAHYYGGSYYYSFAGYAPVYRRYRVRRRSHRHYYGHYRYRRSYYSSYRHAYYGGCY